MTEEEQLIKEQDVHEAHRKFFWEESYRVSLHGLHHQLIEAVKLVPDSKQLAVLREDPVENLVIGAGQMADLALVEWDKRWGPEVGEGEESR